MRARHAGDIGIFPPKEALLRLPVTRPARRPGTETAEAMEGWSGSERG
jgi:hypothetical protein